MRPAPDAEMIRRAEQAVKRFRIDFDAHTAPVDCFRLIQHMNMVHGYPIDLARVGLRGSGFDARISLDPDTGRVLILCACGRIDWKKYSAARRCNFSLAHELGHLFCGHLAVNEQEKSPERLAREDAEADLFAARLLMPAEAMGYFRTVAEAADALYVSESAVRCRMRELGLAYAPRTCPRCGSDRVPLSGRFCRRCGEKLLPGPNEENPPEVAYLPPAEKECPCCGFSYEYTSSVICPDCGVSRRNRCHPEYNQPQHWLFRDADYCDFCGAEAEYKSFRE